MSLWSTIAVTIQAHGFGGCRSSGPLPARMIAPDYARSACGSRRDAEDADVMDSDLPCKLRSPPDYGRGDLRCGRGILGLAFHRDDGRMDLIPQHGRCLWVT